CELAERRTALGECLLLDILPVWSCYTQGVSQVAEVHSSLRKETAMPALRPSVIPLDSFEGTSRHCRQAYGPMHAEYIRAFMLMETPPDKEHLAYAARCWQMLEGWKRPVTDFIKGMAKGSGLSEQELTLLLLHEEIVHAKPCTALGATGPATIDG